MRDIGAFILTGHDIPESTLSTLLDTARAFFSLPVPDRNAIDMIHSPHFRGYSAAGSERTGGVPDAREQWDGGREEPARAIAPRIPAYRVLHGPNLWPAELPAFRPVMLGWMDTALGIAARVLTALGEPAAAIARGASTEPPYEQLKVINYAGSADALQGVGEHTDSGYLALIAHDGARGLQLHDGTDFRDVVAQRGDLIVLAGRALREATNGAIVAAPHRVINPPAGARRISVTAFVNPPLNDGGYGDEALRVVLRSHPHVARRHHPDLGTARAGQ